MKKGIGLLILGLALMIFSACASASSPSLRGTAETAAKAVAPAAGATSIVKDSKTVYSNEELGFSFRIPNSWENDNYTVKVTEGTVKGSDQKFPAVTFLFQNDKENPLLTIEVVPKGVWNSFNDKKSVSSGNMPGYLKSNDSVVYYYTAAQTCPYDVGKKADLFNSMMLPNNSEEITARFQLIDRTGEITLSEASSPPG